MNTMQTTGANHPYYVSWLYMGLRSHNCPSNRMAFDNLIEHLHRIGAENIIILKEDTYK